MDEIYIRTRYPTIIFIGFSNYSVERGVIDIPRWTNELNFKIFGVINSLKFTTSPYFFALSSVSYNAIVILPCCWSPWAILIHDNELLSPILSPQMTSYKRSYFLHVVRVRQTPNEWH